VEALGGDAARAFLERFGRDARADGVEPVDAELLASLDGFLADLPRRYHPPLALSNAIERYRAWTRVNPDATNEAMAQQLDQLADLYHLERHREIARYHLYRHTCFAEAAAPALEAFDRLLEGLRTEPGRPATERVELSDLQAALTEQGERDLFGRLVFPLARRTERFEVVTFGEGEHPQVTVQTHFADTHGDTYDFREPMEPEEVGQLYRLFFQERFPKTPGELDRHLIAVDVSGRVMGGISYRLATPEVAHVDGLVVNSAVGNRGLATALLEDFAVRAASRGVRVLRTSYILREFCEARGFRLDRSWGGLVRILDAGARPAA
jgi:hypothetical protein